MEENFRSNRNLEPSPFTKSLFILPSPNRLFHRALAVVLPRSQGHLSLQNRGSEGGEMKTLRNEVGCRPTSTSSLLIPLKLMTIIGSQPI